MSLFYNDFIKGDYKQCLKWLKSVNSTNIEPEAYFRIHNNEMVCQILANLCTPENYVDRASLLYDNCALTSNHCEISLTLQLGILYNSAWILMFKRGAKTNTFTRFKILFDKFVTICFNICSGSTVVGSSLGLQEGFDLILGAKKTIIAVQSSALVIFTELTNLMLIGLVSISDETPTTFATNEFTKKYLEDQWEMSVSKELEHVADTPVCIVDFQGAPAIIHALELDNAIGLMEIISLATCPLLSRTVALPNSCTRKTKWRPFQLYVVSFKETLRGNYKEALQFALGSQSPIISDVMNSYLHLLLGEIYSNLRERHKAIENFSLSLKLSKKCPIAHYFLGRELGRLGAYESMMKSYRNLLKHSTKREKDMADLTLEEKLLDTVHQRQEISRPKALYVLAVAYGINEMFEEASALFSEIISERSVGVILNEEESNRSRVIELPHITTILHEAATMFMLTGNLHKAELALSQAIITYPNKERPRTQTDLHATRDVDWIRDTLQNQLNIETEQSKQPNKYYEDYLAIFEEDVIGLLLLAEIQRVHQTSDALLTINQALMLLSKYIARTQKESNTENKAQIELITALTSKTCLHVAKMLTPSSNFVEVNKMYKRAMSCNHGDKDVLYHYTIFLREAGKTDEAEKLWNTFYKKEAPIHADELQSLALRHLLRSQTSLRQISDLQRIQQKKMNH